MGTVRRTGSDILKKAASGLDGLQGKVGWFESAKYANGTPVAYVASIQEFGAEAQGIPPRPFMRPTVNENKQKYADGMAKGANAILKGNFTPKAVMERLCIAAAGDVKKTIASIQAPPLKEATIKARQRGYRDKKTKGNLSKPLVHTGLMINTVSYKVDKK